MPTIVDQLEVKPRQEPADDARAAEPAVAPLPSPDVDERIDRNLRWRALRAERLRAD